MKRSVLAILTACFVLSLSTPGKAIDIWHSGNGWVQGMCSYEFTLDGQGVQVDGFSGVSRMVIGVHGFEDNDPDNPFTQELDVGAFADSDATRYIKTYWEGECDLHQFIIFKAIAVIDGQEHDLLKENELHVVESPLKDAVSLGIRY